MLKLISRAWKSRPARKFRRNRLAVAALAVIGLYFAIGITVLVSDALVNLKLINPNDHRLLTVLTLDQVESIVGPMSQPGWLEHPRPEQRLRAVKGILDEFRKALRQKDKDAALAALNLGERRVDKPIDEIRTILDDAKAQYDELNAAPDLDKDVSLLPKLDKIETTVDSLFKPLSGIDTTINSFRLALGTDRQGRSISARAFYSIKVAIQIGLVVAIISVLMGSLIGAAAGYFGGWVDSAVIWLFSTLQSVPDLVLLAVLAFMFTGSVFDDVSKPFLSLIPVYVAMCLTFWIGPCRVIRGETMKLKELEYVQAATAIGFGKPYILLKHIIPNTLHLGFINFSLLFIAAIKFEVVLSFLGLGVKVGPSWGRMIQESTQEVINGFFWQIGTATVFMFFLVLAFNIVSDALQDAFDPKAV
jgi:peptide/nickel transport system permease protein